MKNQLVIDALERKNKNRSPIWIMRQAGRYLPEYRKIREKYSFMKMVKTPELAAEVTLQPLRRFGFDASIIFSDILVIPEVLGKKVRFEEKVGPIFDQPIETLSDVENLLKGDIKETLGYVFEAIKLVKNEIDVPLIGFCGAPFTVASYLIEGRSSKDLKKTKKWMLQHPQAFHSLLEKITEASIPYLQKQVEAGVSAIQLFDSWAHVLSETHFSEFATTYHKKIIDKISVPVILFCRGSSAFVSQLKNAGASCISLDWSCSLAKVRSEIGPQTALQGNMDPYILYGNQAAIKKEAKRILNSMNGDPAFIFNLGHGILPDTPLDSVKTLVETVQCQ